MEDSQKLGHLVDHDEVAGSHAVDAIRAEHEMTFLEAVKLYPKAMAWSAFVSVGVIMLAFDPQLVGNLYGTPQFRRDFGYLYKGEVSPVIPACPSTFPHASQSFFETFRLQAS